MKNNIKPVFCGLIMSSPDNSPIRIGIVLQETAKARAASVNGQILAC
jgi:hypothetical protein